MRFISMIRIEENTGQVPSEQLMSDMEIVAIIEEEEQQRRGEDGTHRQVLAELSEYGG